MGMASGSWKPCSTKSTRCQCWLVLFTLCVVVCLSVLLRGGFHPTNPLHSDIHSVQTSSVQMYRLTPTGRHVHWFEEGSGNFSQRLSAYNQHISSLRQVILSERRQRDWKQLSDKVEVVWCNKDDFMQTLQKYPQVQTVVMPWILTGQEVVSREMYPQVQTLVMPWILTGQEVVSREMYPQVQTLVMPWILTGQEVVSREIYPQVQTLVMP